MWIGILCHTKYEFNPDHKAMKNCVMPYLTMLMITGLKVSKNPENKPINP